MNHLRLAIGFAFVIFAFAPGRAAAWECIQQINIDDDDEDRCPVWCDTAVYSLGEPSEDLGVTDSVIEVQRGMDDWTKVSCTSLTTAYIGRTPEYGGSYSGSSIIRWEHSNWTHGAGAIGVAGPSWRGDGCVVSGAMELNAVNFQWTTGPGSRSLVNAYSIILHEGGHYLGLGHSDSRAAAMYPSYGGGIISLGEDDEEGICTLYPGDGTPPPEGCSVTGCPPDHVCEGQICVPAPPPGCTGPADCAGDEVCDVSTGECEPASPGPAPIGTACELGGDCESGLCAISPEGESVCTSACEPAGEASCPAGFECVPGAGGACGGDGRCFAGAAGSGEVGEECVEHTDCAGLLCDAGVCTVRCGGEGACPEGFECAGDGEECEVCRGPGGAGAECEVDADCASGLCFEPDDGGEPYCTRGCGDDADCPGGGRCLAFDLASVCEAPPLPSAEELRVLEGHCACSAPGAGGGSPVPPLGTALAALLVLGLTLLRRRRATRG